jgi:hypothetical protein
MGWWRTGQGDDIMGDDGADAIEGFLKEHAKIEGQKPSFQELLDATANVLQSDGDSILSNPEALGSSEVEAVFAEPVTTLVSRSRLNTSLKSRLLKCFQDIAKQYLDTEYKRKPRLSEIFSIINFVLCVDPDDLLREAEGAKLLELRVVIL